jgi:hypothetical protein
LPNRHCHQIVFFIHDGVLAKWSCQHHLKEILDLISSSSTCISGAITTLRAGTCFGTGSWPFAFQALLQPSPSPGPLAPSPQPQLVQLAKTWRLPVWCHSGLCSGTGSANHSRLHARSHQISHPPSHLFSLQSSWPISFVRLFFSCPRLFHGYSYGDSLVIIYSFLLFSVVRLRASADSGLCRGDSIRGLPPADNPKTSFLPIDIPKQQTEEETVCFPAGQATAL